MERPARKPGKALLNCLVNAGALVALLLVLAIWAAGESLATEGAGEGDPWDASTIGTALWLLASLGLLDLVLYSIHKGYVGEAPGPSAPLGARRQRASEEAMILDWNDYLKEITSTVGGIAAVSPDIVKGYRTLSEAGGKDSRLSTKTRELIALGVAVTRQCDGCIAVHTNAAIKSGASREELIEALGVAISVNAGSALVFSARTLNAFDAMGSSDSSELS